MTDNRLSFFNSLNSFKDINKLISDGEVENFSSCEEITSSGFNDISNLNPGTRKFSQELERIVYRGLNIVLGTFYMKMKNKKRMLRITITLFSENMRAKYYTVKIYLLKSGKFEIKVEKESYLY